MQPNTGAPSLVGPYAAVAFPVVHWQRSPAKLTQRDFHSTLRMECLHIIITEQFHLRRKQQMRVSLPHLVQMLFRASPLIDVSSTSARWLTCGRAGAPLTSWSKIDKPIPRYIPSPQFNGPPTVPADQSGFSWGGP